MTPDTPEMAAIRADLAAHAESASLAFNPDAEAVERVLAGLAAREKKTGMRLCPCRMAAGDPEENRKIACPCVFHREEIARDGHCHCRLFVPA